MVIGGTAHNVPMALPTSVLIRVQALGGKFLGPDIGYSLVTIRDAVTGEVLAQGVASGDSGVLTTNTAPSAPPAGATTNTVITGMSFQWLSPDAGTAGFRTTLDLDVPLLVDISAAALINGLPSSEHVTSARMWLTPGVNFTADPGLVLVMPGLNVQFLTPNPAQPAASPLSVTAWVTMMCGCKISTTTDWPPSEFNVVLTVLDLAGNSIAQQTLELQQTSVYYNHQPIDLPANADYQLVITALQASTSNSGSASTYISL